MNQQYEQRLSEQQALASKRLAQLTQKNTPDHFTEKSLLEVESQERFSQRKAQINEHDTLGLERILGTNDLLPINFLTRGAKAAKAICRVNIMSPSGIPEGYGTGFMVSRRLMLTNHHVLPDPMTAKHSYVEFSYERDEHFRQARRDTFELRPDNFFFADKNLDFCLVAVAESSQSNTTLQEHGFIKLIEATGKGLVGEHACIIQHPRGMMKQISLRDSRIMPNQWGRDEFIHYEADTEPGSSGSPVFNDNWQLVALHHASVPKQDTNGNIHWVANEGVRVSAIFSRLRQASKEQQWSTRANEILQEFAKVSTSSFNVDQLENLQSTVIDAPRVPYKREIDKPIDFEALRQKIYTDDYEEHEIAPYFRLAKNETLGIDPVFEINPDLVHGTQRDTAQESALVLNSANWICKRYRRKKFLKKRKNPGTITIVSEGDSWFQYPLLLEDTIDHLMNDERFAICSLGEAGGLLKDMVAKREFTQPIHDYNAQFFLVSGGGNDMVDGHGIRRFINKPRNSFDLQDLINHSALFRFGETMQQHYATLFQSALATQPKLNIICHGYSYAIPNDGRWLGRPMAEMGIKDLELQRRVMNHIVDKLNQAVSKTARDFAGKVTYIDMRDLVPENGWYDEFHPTNRYFGAVAEEIRQVIDKKLGA